LFYTIQQLPQSKQLKKTKNKKILVKTFITFFPVSLSDIVCTPRHFSSHLCLITGLFFDNFWLLIRPCCLIVYIFSFSFFLLSHFTNFFCSNLPFHQPRHICSLKVSVFFGINPPHPWLEITQKEKKLHNYPFLTRRFFPGSLWLYSKLKPIHQYHPDFTDERNPSVLKLYTI